MSLKEKITYLFLQILSLSIRILPRKLALWVGRNLGGFIRVFIPVRKKVAEFNVKKAFPHKSTIERNIIIKKMYHHFGMLMMDFLRSPNMSKKSLHKILKVDEDTKSLLDSKKGGIIMSAHLGNWELFLPAIGMDYSFSVVYQTQRNKGSDIFFQQARSFKHIQLIPRKGAKLALMRALKNGSFLGLASDQNAGKAGVKVNFFGKPSSIPKGAAHFHLKTHSPILVGFCILSDDYSYSLSLQEMDLGNLPTDNNEAIKVINQQFSHILEDIITKYPHQYFWFHKKWDKKMYSNIKQ